MYKIIVNIMKTTWKMTQLTNTKYEEESDFDDEYISNDDDININYDHEFYEQDDDDDDNDDDEDDDDDDDDDDK